MWVTLPSLEKTPKQGRTSPNGKKPRHSGAALSPAKLRRSPDMPKILSELAPTTHDYITAQPSVELVHEFEEESKKYLAVGN